jgi:hypothetical protein
MAGSEGPSESRADADGQVNPSFPDFLKPAVVIDLRPALVPRIAQGFSMLLGVVGAKRQGGKLTRPFFLEQQQQSNWCWASVGVALHRFSQNERLTQCELVRRTRNLTGVNCCATPGHAQCNVTEIMSKVFDTLTLVRRSPQPEGALVLSDIRSDISANCPIVCAMFGGQTAHFVVMVGWAIVDGVESVIFDDPANGVRVQRSLRAFKTNYNGRQWAQSTRLAR